MVKFEPLWATMDKRMITQYQLINDYGMSRGQLDRIKQNENITTNTLDVLCNILQCNMDDIVTHIKDDNNRFKPLTDENLIPVAMAVLKEYLPL